MIWIKRNKYYRQHNPYTVNFYLNNPIINKPYKTTFLICREYYDYYRVELIEAIKIIIGNWKIF